MSSVPLEKFASIGLSTLGSLIVPTVVWTVVALVIWRALKSAQIGSSPEVRLAVAAALLCALPLGILGGHASGGLFRIDVLLPSTGVATLPTNHPPASANRKNTGSIAASFDDERAAGPGTADVWNRGINSRESVRRADEPLTTTRPTSAVTPAPAASRNVQLLLILCGIVGLSLVVLCVIASIRLLIQLRGLRNIRRNAHDVTDGELYQLFRSIARDLSVPVASGGRHRAATNQPGRVALCTADSVDSPLTFGLLQPIVVLPSNLTEDARAVRAALVHELNHVRRGDWGLQLSLVLLTVPFAWHPLVALLLREVACACEERCDRSVLDSGAVALPDYLGILISIVETREAVRTSSQLVSLPRLTLGATQSMLRRRITSMQSRVSRTHPLIPPALATLALAIPVVLAACSTPAPQGSDSTSSQITAVSQESVAALDVKVKYLREEYVAVRREVGRLRQEERDATIADSSQAYLSMLRAEATFEGRRSALIDELLTDAMREREYMKMELIAKEAL